MALPLPSPIIAFSLALYDKLAYAFSPMKRQRSIFIGLMALLLVGISASCAKDETLIGWGNPEDEYKTCLGYSKDKDYEKAIECFEIFRSRFPDTDMGREAQLVIGDVYFRKKEFLSAATSYQSFIQLQAGNPKMDYAYYRLGLSYLKQTPKSIDRDQEYLDEAVRYLDYFVRSYPSSAYYDLGQEALADAHKRLAKRLYYIGHFYFKTGEYIAAIPRFEELANSYSSSGMADEALYRIVVANTKLLRVDAAKTAFSRLATDFPQSRWTKRAEKAMLKMANKLTH